MRPSAEDGPGFDQLLQQAMHRRARDSRKVEICCRAVGLTNRTRSVSDYPDQVGGHAGGACRRDHDSGIGGLEHLPIS
jgi:hypothetical protein